MVTPFKSWPVYARNHTRKMDSMYSDRKLVEEGYERIGEEAFIQKFSRDKIALFELKKESERQRDNKRILLLFLSIHLAVLPYETISNDVFKIGEMEGYLGGTKNDCWCMLKQTYSFVHVRRKSCVDNHERMQKTDSA